ncbi:MAG: homoserine dehydrogenase, partial [Methylophilaceae bacterium]
TFDVEGIDAAHKLVIMASIAFGMPLKFDEVYTEGITQLAQTDIKYAEELGYTIKLLAVTKRTDKGIELRVHPTLIPKKRLVANVDGAMNAVVVQGDAVGPTLYYGAGAGAEPTASAVVADLIDVARLKDASDIQRVPALGYQANQVQDLPVLPITEISSAYYLRMHATDKPGVIAAVTKILGDKSISIDAMIQPAATTGADIVFLTHETVEKNMDAAIAEIEALPDVEGSLVKLRMETLG